MNAAIFLCVIVIVWREATSSSSAMAAAATALTSFLSFSASDSVAERASELLVGIFSRELRLSCSAAN